MHVAIGYEQPASVSTQIAALRRTLLAPQKSDIGAEFSKVTMVSVPCYLRSFSMLTCAQGLVPLVIRVNSADAIASILQLKAEVEHETKKSMRVTLVGAAEAHILADDIAAAGVGVILVPPRPFPYTWEHRRM